jgi:hypothetical protein
MPITKTSVSAWSNRSLSLLFCAGSGADCFSTPAGFESVLSIIETNDRWPCK